jgi:hypothetical protein
MVKETFRVDSTVVQLREAIYGCNDAFTHPRVARVAASRIDKDDFEGIIPVAWRRCHSGASRREARACSLLPWAT